MNNFFNKGISYFKRLKKFLLYKNNHYKPKKVSTVLNSKEVTSKIIYNEYKIELPVNIEFFNKISKFTIYDNYKKINEFQYSFNNYQTYLVKRIKNGRIYSDNIQTIAIINNNNELDSDLSYQYHIDKEISPQKNNIFKINYYDHPKYIDGNLFHLLAGGAVVLNYAHWLFDVLPRFFLLKKSGWFEEIDFFLLPSYQYDFQKDSLAKLSIPKEKVIIAKGSCHFKARNLIASSYTRGQRSYLIPPWVNEFYKKYFIGNRIKNEAFKYIYISRKDSNLRKVKNEDELIEKLKIYNFRILELSQFSFEEKIDIFFSAEFIIGASGAGLANLFFCNEKAKVLELFSEGFVGTHYYNIAYNLGIEYQSIIFKSNNPASNMKSGQLEDIYIDMDLFEKHLNTFIGNHEYS